jgi:ATP-dependent DNA ligase
MLLPNLGAGTTIVYYAFDVKVLNSRDLTSDPLSARREYRACVNDLIAAGRAHGLEGLVAKRLEA